jgi:zinc transport system ATP-binding protein
MKNLLTIENLRVELGGKVILNGLDCCVERGKITALIGLNGSGKTTLLRTLLQECPYQGKVQFHCGHDHHRYRPEHIGYVPQKLTIEPKLPLTVRELFALALQRRPLLFGISRSVSARAEALLSHVKANHLLDRPVSKLSGGELQRVLLSMALDPHPELLLLDEPAAGIDFVDQVPFYDLLAQINQQTGVTILLVSHDLSVVSRQAHHVLCLKNGRIECQGTPQDVMTAETLSKTFGADKRAYAHHHHH